jgi:hypothetical protein
VRRLAAALGLAGLILATGACSATVRPEGDFGLGPECAVPSGDPDRTVILMAQAVPTASQLPCLRDQPPFGWHFAGFDIRNGMGQFWLDSDRDGPKALIVQVSDSCETGGSTRVPSQQPGVEQFERVTRVTGGYGGERYHVYPGGCTTYRFNLQGPTRAQPLAAIAASLGFVSRDVLRQQVQDLDPRLRLDPP